MGTIYPIVFPDSRKLCMGSVSHINEMSGNRMHGVLPRILLAPGNDILSDVSQWTENISDFPNRVNRIFSEPAEMRIGFMIAREHIPTRIQLGWTHGIRKRSRYLYSLKRSLASLRRHKFNQMSTQRGVHPVLRSRCFFYKIELRLKCMLHKTSHGKLSTSAS